jgi:hypothetical protein
VAGHRWPLALLLVGTVLAGVVLAAAVAAEPDAVGSGGRVLPPALVLVLFGYAAVAVTGLRAPTPGQEWGAVFGVVAGVLWLVEITAGGPVFLPRGWEVAVGGAFAATAAVTTVAAAVWAATRAGALAGMQTGLVAGLVSGLIVFIGGVTMTLLFVDRLGERADYQRELARSHMSGMHAFLVQDALTGYGAHLLINPVLGLFGAVLGWLAVAGAVRGHRADGA